MSCKKKVKLNQPPAASLRPAQGQQHMGPAYPDQMIQHLPSSSHQLLQHQQPMQHSSQDLMNQHRPSSNLQPPQDRQSQQHEGHLDSGEILPRSFIGGGPPLIQHGLDSAAPNLYLQHASTNRGAFSQARSDLEHHRSRLRHLVPEPGINRLFELAPTFPEVGFQYPTAENDFGNLDPAVRAAFKPVYGSDVNPAKHIMFPQDVESNDDHSTEPVDAMHCGKRPRQKRPPVLRGHNRTSCNTTTPPRAFPHRPDTPNLRPKMHTARHPHQLLGLQAVALHTEPIAAHLSARLAHLNASPASRPSAPLAPNVLPLPAPVPRRVHAFTFLEETSAHHLPHEPPPPRPGPPRHHPPQPRHRQSRAFEPQERDQRPDIPAVSSP